MTGPFRKISFASGKGGVGKTLLAANFARLCSTKRRCLLLDLDFQNQGCSGLLSDELYEGCANSFDMLSGAAPSFENIIQLREQLWFLPSFDPGKSDRYSLQHNPMFLSLGLGRLHEAVEILIQQNWFDLIIFDTHGGLDDLSFAAFIDSDCTIVISEPDKVTFNGTLELLDYYIERAEQAADCKTVEPDNILIQSRLRDVANNQIHFLVNRSSGKYRYRTLLDILSRAVALNVPSLKIESNQFSFFPADPLLGESFSEHPFFVELLPESIFTQKLELLHFSFFGEAPIIEGRSVFYRMFEKKSRNALRTQLASAYEERVRAIFSFAAAAQAFIIFFFSFALPLVGLSGEKKAISLDSLGAKLAAAAMCIFIAALSYMAVSANARLSGYYRDRWRYETRLWRKGGRRRSAAFLIRLLIICVCRFAPYLMTAFFALYVLTFIIFAFAVIFGFVPTIDIGKSD